MKWEFSFPWSQDPNKDIKDKIKAAMDQATNNAQTQSYLGPLMKLIPQYLKRYNEATSNINNLFSNAPNLNLSDYSKSLSGLSGDLSTLGKGVSSDLAGIRSSTTSDVNKYLNSTNKYLGSTSDYIKSLLNETQAGTSQYLKGYQALARGNMPGLNIYNEQNATNTATNIQALKNLGVDSSSALTSILNNNQNTGANIALQAAQYKTQAQQNLADAALKSGTTNAGAFTTATNLEQQNAAITQQNASIAQNLGQFNAGVSEANAGIQSNILGTKTNIINTQAGFAQNEYNANMSKWLTQYDWNKTLATASDPLAFETQLFGEAAGLQRADYLTNQQTQIQNKQSQSQNLISIASIIATLLA